MELLICDHAARCGNYSCPHCHPHYSYPIPSRNNLPQCLDKDTYCYHIQRAVNCQPLKRGNENDNSLCLVRKNR